MDLNSLLLRDYKNVTLKNIDAFRNKWASALGFTPKNSHILASYRDLVKTGSMPKTAWLDHYLMTRRVRSQSGVTPFAVMTGPFTCPGQCTFCPLEVGMPRSYLSDEPAAQRALSVNFDPFLQVKNRLQQLSETGHSVDKIELIVVGGTFSAYPKQYKIDFFLGIYNAINGSMAKDIPTAQAFNETAKRRIVGISIETRPDWLDETEIRLLRWLGVTRLQIGVQALDGKILKRVQRGHSIRPIAKATRDVKNAGFKVCYHYMPNLPGSNPAKDVAMAKTMYLDPRFKPDTVKIYPTQIIPKTILFRQWERGEFNTYNDSTLMKVLTRIKLITPPYCRIDRLVRDISKKWVADGTHHTNMRQTIQARLKSLGKICHCVRCREIKGERYDEIPSLRVLDIATNGGMEKFISFETDQHLYSLLRLRLPNRRQIMIFSELNGAAIIREVHTYGVVADIDTVSTDKTQHQGLGKKMIAKAEEIAKTAGYPKIAVISAIGTREYYKKLGYGREGTYMTKLF